MKKNFITCVSFLSIMSLFSCSSEKEFNRWGDKLTQYVVEEYMPAKDYIWNWNEAVFLKSAVVRCENNMDKDYLFPYIQTAVDSTFGDANGHHPNAVISGLGLAYLAQTTDTKTKLMRFSNNTRISPEPPTEVCHTEKK